MSFLPEQEAMIKRDYADACGALNTLRTDLVYELSPKLKNARAIEYLQQGVCRRLKLLQRALIRVFEIFPVDRTNKLTEDERTDVEINIHAFMVNVHGLLDNLAWIFVFEKDLEGAIGSRLKVDLFKKATQDHLPAALRTYLTTTRIKEWHSRYAKIFRDALAHRIPLYIPPSIMTNEEGARYKDLERQYGKALAALNFKLATRIVNEQESLGQVCAMFNHSFNDPESNSPVYLHPQMIADARTVIEVAEKVLEALS